MNIWIKISSRSWFMFVFNNYFELHYNSVVLKTFMCLANFLPFYALYFTLLLPFFSCAETFQLGIIPHTCGVRNVSTFDIVNEKEPGVQGWCPSLLSIAITKCWLNQLGDGRGYLTHGSLCIIEGSQGINSRQKAVLKNKPWRTMVAASHTFLIWSRTAFPGMVPHTVGCWILYIN